MEEREYPVDVAREVFYTRVQETVDRGQILNPWCIGKALATATISNDETNVDHILK
jgi:hypothetical protein